MTNVLVCQWYVLPLASSDQPRLGVGSCCTVKTVLRLYARSLKKNPSGRAGATYRRIVRIEELRNLLARRAQITLVECLRHAHARRHISFPLSLFTGATGTPWMPAPLHWRGNNGNRTLVGERCMPICGCIATEG